MRPLPIEQAFDGPPTLLAILQRSPRPRWTLENVMTFERYRDKNGDISHQYGNILIRRLRQYYGPAFGKGCGDNERLSAVLHKLDEGSL